MRSKFVRFLRWLRRVPVLGWIAGIVVLGAVALRLYVLRGHAERRVIALEHELNRIRRRAALMAISPSDEAKEKLAEIKHEAEERYKELEVISAQLKVKPAKELADEINRIFGESR